MRCDRVRGYEIDDDGYESGYSSGHGDDFRVGGGRSYATERGGSAEAEGGSGGLNFNWWYEATGCGQLCPRELTDRLDGVVKGGEGGARPAATGKKRSNGKVGGIEDGVSRKRMSLSPRSSALLEGLLH